MHDEYTKVVAKIPKGERLATAMNEEGVLWSGRVMSEIMPNDPYWALFTSRERRCDQRRVDLSDCLMWKRRTEVDDEMSVRVAWIAGLKVLEPPLNVCPSLAV